MTLNRKWLVFGILTGLLIAVSAWAITTNQIWQNVYDSSNTALRLNIVAGS